MYTEPLGRLGVLIFLIISCWYLVDFNEINRDKFDLKKYYKGKLVRFIVAQLSRQKSKIFIMN